MMILGIKKDLYQMTLYVSMSFPAESIASSQLPLVFWGSLSKALETATSDTTV